MGPLCPGALCGFLASSSQTGLMPQFSLMRFAICYRGSGQLLIIEHQLELRHALALWPILLHWRQASSDSIRLRLLSGGLFACFSPGTSCHRFSLEASSQSELVSTCPFDVFGQPTEYGFGSSLPFLKLRDYTDAFHHLISNSPAVLFESRKYNSFDFTYSGMSTVGI